VSKFGDESSISKYIRDQGLEKEYAILHKSKQLAFYKDTPLLWGGEFHLRRHCLRFSIGNLVDRTLIFLMLIIRYLGCRGGF
jgi:hypothetical protein